MSSVRDKGIGWLRKRLYIPLIATNGWTTAAGPVIQSLGAGTKNLTTRTGLNMAAFVFSAAADAFEFDAECPYDIDMSKEVGVRVIWTSNAAAVGARTVTWTVFFNMAPLTAAFATSLGGGATAAQVQAATALDTPLAVETPAGVNNAIQVSNRGIIKASTLLAFAGSGGGALHYWWGWRIVMTAFNAAFVENKYVLGLEVDYMLHKTFGPGRLTSSKVLASPFNLGTRPDQE